MAAGGLLCRQSLQTSRHCSDGRFFVFHPHNGSWGKLYRLQDWGRKGVRLFGFYFDALPGGP
jgi:hypothetical protein